MSGSILKEAEAAINGPRNKTYGDFRENWERTCALFYQMTGIKLSADEGLMFMLCVKLAREAHSHKRDNLVDLCGYAELFSRMKGE